MSIAEIRSRLAMALSAEENVLRPASLGERTATAAGRLRTELRKPTTIRVADRKYRSIGADADLGAAMIQLSSVHPDAGDVSIALLGNAPSELLAPVQADFLETCFTAATALAAGGWTAATQMGALTRMAASATRVGGLLRGQLGGGTGRVPPLDRPTGGLPGLDGLTEDLLKAAESWQRTTCARAVNAALRNWAEAIHSNIPRYIGTIVKLAPATACPEEELTVEGRGFGSSAGRSRVVFTSRTGGIVVAEKVLEWSDHRIHVIIPATARRGPLGVAELPESPMLLAEAASTALGEIGQCFGRAAIARVQARLPSLTIPVFPLPTLQPDHANLYSGGPPIIQHLRVAPTGPLWPGKTITVSWSVEGADEVQIFARGDASSPAHDLPPIPGLLPASGSASVVVPGKQPWRASYELVAKNRCQSATCSLELEMVRRRGLALGGGGARGDFQAGALQYLYDQKNYRPDAVAGTSVGAINAIDLALGDGLMPDPTQNAAARLAQTWLELRNEGSMWAEEPWLVVAKDNVRRAVRSFSLQGLLFFPFMIASGVVSAIDVKNMFVNPRKYGATAMFNLDPIERTMRSKLSATQAAPKIPLRLVSASLETGQLILVDERGQVRQRGPNPPGNAGAAPTTDVVDGAIASAAMPGIFRARRLGDHMCVDGGVKDVVPVQIAVHELGCHDVIAIRLTAPPALLETDPLRSFGEVTSRALFQMAFDEMADNDIQPWGGIGGGVKVTTIRPTFDLHDPMVVAPGLIRIAMDYGWMRAGDVLDVPESDRAAAMVQSDEITRKRAQNWLLTHHAAGLRIADPHRAFTNFAFAGAFPSVPKETVPIEDHKVIEKIRSNCRDIREYVRARAQLGAPLPSVERQVSWFTQWEVVDDPPTSPSPWDKFVGSRGEVAAATPPDLT